jgi:hypothetical protein
MAKIVDIESYNEDYKKYLESTKADLIDFKENLYGIMINLATRGKWKEWNSKMREGDEFTFSLDMLLNAGDKNIDLLFELFTKTDETINGMK